MYCDWEYNFVNSRAIKFALQSECGYLTSADYIYIIHRSVRHTLDEKIEAWQNMIDDASKNKDLCNILQSYITLQQKKIMNYLKPDNAVYTYRYMRRGNDIQFDGTYYSSHKSCVEACKKEISEYDDLIYVRLTKNFTDGSSDYIRLNMNCNMEIMSVIQSNLSQEDKKTDSCISEISPSFSLPFKVGDIVINPYVEEFYDGFCYKAERRPIVIHYADAKENLCFGYYFDGEGLHNVEVDWYNLEYCPEPIIGENRFLKAVSSFLRGNITLPILLKAKDVISAEIKAEQDKKSIEKEYLNSNYILHCMGL